MREFVPSAATAGDIAATNGRHDPFAPAPTSGAQPFDPVELARARLEECGYAPRPQSNGQLLARCPAHNDHNPSLSVGRGKDGRVLFRCHAGCTQDEVRVALDLTWAELFVPGGNTAPQRQTADDVEPLPSEEELTAAKNALHCDSRTLGELIFKRMWSLPTIVAYGLGLADDGIVVPFHRGGTLLTFERYKLPSRRGSGPKMVAPRGRRRELLLPPGEMPDEVWLCEGLSDTLAAASADLPAVGLPSANWNEQHTETLRGEGVRRTVVVLDCDDAGRRATAHVSSSLAAAGISTRVIDLDPNRSDGYDLTDFFHEHGHEHGRDLLAQLASEAAPLDLREDWPALGVRDVPPFPEDALPPAVANWTRAVAQHTQTPVDLPALAALGVLSAAALGSAIVDCCTWEEEIGFYGLLVMPSGDRKSSVLREAVKPLRLIERQRQDAAAPALAKARARRTTLEARGRELAKRMGGDDAADAEDEFARVDAQLASLGQLVASRMFADDATPEAVGALLAQHGSMAVLASESALLDNLLGRYSDGAVNLHLACAAYSGEPVTIDRKGHDPQYLERPLLTILLCVQPHVIAKLLANETARSQGLVARFALVRPQTLLGRRQVDAPAPTLDIAQAWNDTVRRVASAESADNADNGASPVELASFTRDRTVSIVSVSQVRRLVLSPSAHELLKDLQRQIEPRLAPEGDLRPIADWVARHHGRAARIAGLLHLCGHQATEPISAQTMTDALRIANYLLEHARAVFTAPDELTRRAIDWLRQRGEQTVTQRDLHRGPLAGRHNADAARKLAERLEELGVIRASPGNHPTSRRYDVHPELFGGDVV